MNEEHQKALEAVLSNLLDQKLGTTVGGKSIGEQIAGLDKSLRQLESQVAELTEKSTDLEFNLQSTRNAFAAIGTRTYGRDTTMAASAPFNDSRVRERYNIHHS